MPVRVAAVLRSDRSVKELEGWAATVTARPEPGTYDVSMPHPWLVFTTKPTEGTERVTPTPWPKLRDL